MNILKIMIALLAGTSIVACNKDDAPTNDGMPPAASKQAAEERASQSGGGQFSRQSDSPGGDGPSGEK